jgi:polyhydroxyalkanoate synthesis repressor PhaR
LPQRSSISPQRGNAPRRRRARTAAQQKAAPIVADKKTSAKDETEQPPVKIKKYANRRLYNTATSSYVTLDHLCQMVKEDIDFVVEDAKTGEDITRSVLTQIIVEEEGKGQNLLPISFLRQLISFYGHGMQGVVPAYLEQMMSAFAANQEQMAQYMQNAMGGRFPYAIGNLEEMSKANMEMLQRTMNMFTPFGGEGNAAAGSEGGEAPAPEGDQLDNLKEQVDQLQKQLEAISKTRK